jgi:hypothetical protein
MLLAVLVFFNSCFVMLFLPFLMILHRWISVGSDLKFDARRDLDDVGATCIEGKKSLKL